MPTFLNNKINVLYIRFGGLILPSHFWDEKNKNPSQIRDAINTNLIKFLPYSELCSMFNNKANLFRFSHSKSNEFNKVTGHRISSQGRVPNKK